MILVIIDFIKSYFHDIILWIVITVVLFIQFRFFLNAKERASRLTEILSDEYQVVEQQPKKAKRTRPPKSESLNNEANEPIEIAIIENEQEVI